MATKTWKKFQLQADQTKALADRLKAIFADINGLVDQHNKMDYSDAGSDPAYVLESVDGNIKGHTFTPADYMSFVTMALQLQNFFGNTGVATGDYLASVETIANPTATGD